MKKEFEMEIQKLQSKLKENEIINNTSIKSKQEDTEKSTD